MPSLRTTTWKANEPKHKSHNTKAQKLLQATAQKEIIYQISYSLWNLHIHSNRREYFLSQISYAQTSKLLGKGDKTPLTRKNLLNLGLENFLEQSFHGLGHTSWDSKNRRNICRHTWENSLRKRGSVPHVIGGVFSFYFFEVTDINT